MAATEKTLAPLFRAVGEALRSSQSELNAADPYNGNHGDHMVQVFETAAQAAERQRDASLADAMQAAAEQLAQQNGNGSARLYALGLEQVAQQLRRYDISLEDLLSYVSRMLAEDAEPAVTTGTHSGDILKALAGGLVGWKAAAEDRDRQATSAEQGLVPWYLSPTSGSGQLDMNALFDLGVAYMQAKQRGGKRSQILADAAASASPLNRTPHRYQSGKLAIQALLEAIASQA